MVISSWKNAALASLLTAGVTGQQVIFMPMSNPTSGFLGATGPNGNGGMIMDPFLFGTDRSLSSSAAAWDDEPPCRKRRLEPWRSRVRQECPAAAILHCAAAVAAAVGDDVVMESRDLRRGEWTRPSSMVMSSASSPLEEEVDSFFGALFAPPPPRPPPTSSQNEGPFSGDAGEEDPFDKVLGDILGFSLRAFDRAATMDFEPSVSSLFASPLGEEAGDEDVVSWSEDAVVPPPRQEGEEESVEEKGEKVEEDSVELTPTPEQAAESALDLMVASLARSIAVMGSSDSSTEEEEQELVDAVDQEEPPLSVGNLPQLLSRMGENLLSETHSARRRLSEEGGEADARLQAKERLARRLTEYQTNLVFSPEDNTVTLYTTSYGFAPSAFPVSPFFGGVALSSPSPPPLGMGSARVDECLRSRFDDGDLKGTRCHRAVGELLLAVDHGSPDSPHHAEFGAPETAQDNVGFFIFFEDISSLSDDSRKDCTNAALLGLGMLLSGALLVHLCLGSCEDDDEDDDEANEFGYASLSEEDGEERCSKELVFVGVPVQVV